MAVFWQLQARSRRNTLALIAIFLILMTVLTVGVGGAALLTWHYFSQNLYLTYEQEQRIPVLILIGAVAFANIIILVGAIIQLRRLQIGGMNIARLLGARRIYPSDREPCEKRALNVLEEVSLAGGLPPIPLYVLEEEQSINALAVGVDPQDAAIVLTNGALRLLTRDELQGVLAHELAHVFNRDSRFNIALAAILHGVLYLRLMGEQLMRTGDSEDESGADMVYKAFNRNRFVWGAKVLGLALKGLGWIGLFLGRMLKAAVCRQREYLADASAVAYARNPAGLAGALKKIAGLEFGSEVLNPQAEVFSHFFFAEGIEGLATGLFSTHPPVELRIIAIDPVWDGTIEELTYGDLEEKYAARWSAGEEEIYSFPVEGREQLRFRIKAAVTKAEVIAPVPEILSGEIDILQTIPAAVIRVAHEPYGARALLYSLLLSSDPERRYAQLEILRGAGDRVIGRKLKRLMQVVPKLEPDLRDLLIRLMIPILKELSLDEFEELKLVLAGLISTGGSGPDGGDELIVKLVQDYLAPNFRPKFGSDARR